MRTPRDRDRRQRPDRRTTPIVPLRPHLSLSHSCLKALVERKKNGASEMAAKFIAAERRTESCRFLPGFPLRAHGTRPARPSFFFSKISQMTKIPLRVTTRSGFPERWFRRAVRS